MKKVIMVALCLMSAVVTAGNDDSAARATIEKFVGIDLDAVQTNKAVVVALPEQFGMLTNATVFADNDGRIVQVRCIADCDKNVSIEEAKAKAKDLLGKSCKRFDAPPAKELHHETAEYYAEFHVQGNPRYKAVVYADEARNNNKPLGYRIVVLTFFIQSIR
jgi:hypothetical protein